MSAVVASSCGNTWTVLHAGPDHLGLLPPRTRALRPTGCTSRTTPAPRRAGCYGCHTGAKAGPFAMAEVPAAGGGELAGGELAGLLKTLWNAGLITAAAL